MINPHKNPNGTFYRNRKIPPPIIWILKEQKKMLKISHFLISKYIMKLQSSKQYKIGIKTDTSMREIRES